MMRPKVVTVTTWLMAILNFFGYAVLWNTQEKPTQTVIAVFIGCTVVIAVGCAVLWFYYHGKNWARLAVLLASASILINNYLAFPSANPIVKVVDVAKAVVAVFMLIWLNTSEAKKYFNLDEPELKPELTDDADVVEFTAAIEETFGVNCTEKMAEPNLTVQVLSDWLAGLVGGKHPNNHARELLHQFASKKGSRELAQPGVWKSEQIVAVVVAFAELWLGVYPATANSNLYAAVEHHPR